MMANGLHRVGLVPLVFLIVGCSSSAARLTVDPVDEAPQYERFFEEAYARRAPDGQYDILLIDEGRGSRTRPGVPLEPSDVRPVRQVVHLRVHWLPRGVRSDHPSATNASIDWYVFGAGVGGQADVLHYRGAGFVKLYPGKKTVEAQIRTAELEPKTHRGAMADPLGRSSLTGVASAKRDAEEVRLHLDLIESQLAQSPQPAAGLEGPPARKQRGP